MRGRSRRRTPRTTCSADGWRVPWRRWPRGGDQPPPDAAMRHAAEAVTLARPPASGAMSDNVYRIELAEALASLAFVEGQRSQRAASCAGIARRSPSTPRRTPRRRTTWSKPARRWPPAAGERRGRQTRSARSIAHRHAGRADIDRGRADRARIVARHADCPRCAAGLSACCGTRRGRQALVLGVHAQTCESRVPRRDRHRARVPRGAGQEAEAGSSRRVERAAPFHVNTRGGTRGPATNNRNGAYEASPAARRRAASGAAASAASVVTRTPRPDPAADGRADDSGVVGSLVVQEREHDSGVLRRDPGAARVAVDGRGEAAVRVAPPPRRTGRRAIAPLVAVHHHNQRVAPANPAERAHPRKCGCTARAGSRSPSSTDSRR